MNEILNNLALVLLIDHCKKNNIDCSGTHLEKLPRKWAYFLTKDTTGEIITTVTFTKNTIPIFTH